MATVGIIECNSYSQKGTLTVIATTKSTALIVMSTANLKSVTVTVADYSEKCDTFHCSKLQPLRHFSL